MKRKCLSESSDDQYLTSLANGKSTLNFNDMCDDMIDMILCHLQLEDLSNVSDTCIRLRDIADSVFSRKHAHRLISMDVFHYSRNLTDKKRKYFLHQIAVNSKCDAIIRISDAKVSLKLVRNFRNSIKHVRIQSTDYDEIYIPNALRKLIRNISELCNNSIETLEVIGCSTFTLTEPLTKLQEFCCYAERLEISQELAFMPNVRALKLHCVPKTMAKNYAKLKRIDLQLESDDDVETFISFTRLNPQMEYLRLYIWYHCSPQYNRQIYSSIANNLTQLKTLKLGHGHQPIWMPIEESRYSFRTVESFRFSHVDQRIAFLDPQHVFEFDHLKKLTLSGTSSFPMYCMNTVRRNKKLKILKLDTLHGAFLNETFIKELLNELPELEEIIVDSFSENRYLAFKKILGKEWEQFEKEKTGIIESSSTSRLRRCHKTKSTA